MRPVHLVAHTHWDREWYLPFEGFRDKLIPTLDLILDLLNGAEGWTHFHLDGQTQMVDDYLDVKPEREPELMRHIASGALSIGPWVTLVDEFLVSGESIIRNLEDGLARSRALGGQPTIAYLPDQFGHVGQMPQILRSMGLASTVVWRGVPAAVTGSHFMWRAPDGSEVNAFYLPHGYGQGARMESEADAFATRIATEVARLEPFLGDGEPALVPVGDDHEQPLRNLPVLIEHLSSSGTPARLVSYAEHLGGVRHPGVTITGELRSGARANLLPNTYSVRPQQKIDRARAEHLLERYAEPLAALVPGGEWPDEDLKDAWHLLHLNGAHDSVCGCSTDEVAAAVDARTHEATEIAADVIAGALGRLAASTTEVGVLVFNPAPFERFGVPGLGWKVMESFEPGPIRLSPIVRGDAAAFLLGDVEISLSVEDQADAGDLYTFAAEGLAEFGALSIDNDDASFETSRATVVLSAWRVPGEDFLRLHVEVENRKPDHRLRLCVEMEDAAEGSLAGAPFEVVERGPVSEGGESEPPSSCWPARGFACAGGRCVLAEGVFEYEIADRNLAVTLMRCTGNISRQELDVRKVVAGPDVPTPEAQLLGHHVFAFGLGAGASGPEAIRMWDSFALEPLVTSALGEGVLPNQGSLLRIEGTALSSVRRVGADVVATVWNPAPEAAPAMVGDQIVRLEPHQIVKVYVR